MSKSSFPLTQFIIDLQKASTMQLTKMDIAATAKKCGLPVAWVKHYRDVEVAAR